MNPLFCTISAHEPIVDGFITDPVELTLGYTPARFENRFRSLTF